MEGWRHIRFVEMVATAVPTGAGFSRASSVFGNLAAIPIWGVPVTTFGAAAAGAGLSLFFGDPVASRRELWGQIMAATFFGTALAALLSRGFQWEWASSQLSMFALVLAAVIRWFLPVAIERVKQIIREYKISFNFGKPKKGDD